MSFGMVCHSFKSVALVFHRNSHSHAHRHTCIEWKKWFLVNSHFNIKVMMMMASSDENISFFACNSTYTYAHTWIAPAICAYINSQANSQFVVLHYNFRESFRLIFLSFFRFLTFHFLRKTNTYHIAFDVRKN